MGANETTHKPVKLPGNHGQFGVDKASEAYPALEDHEVSADRPKTPNKEPDAAAVTSSDGTGARPAAPEHG